MSNIAGLFDTVRAYLVCLSGAYACTAYALHLPFPTVPAGTREELDRLLENPTLKSIFETLSAFLNIEKDVLHDFIAGLATSGLASGGVVADPESAARFQRELLKLLTAGNPTRVEHDAYVSRAMDYLSKMIQLTSWPIIGNPTLIAHEAETGAAAELLHEIGPSPEPAAYVKRHKNGTYETCCTGLINQYAARDALDNGPMEALGNGAARKIFAAVMDFLPGNDAAGAFKKGDGSQQCYTPPTAVLSRVLADQSMKVLTHAADAGFVVICVEGMDETELLLQCMSWMSRLDACSTSAAFAHPHDADPLYAVQFRHDGPLALLVSSPSSGACIFGPFRLTDERALVLNHFLARTNFFRELSGIAALPDNQSALVAYCGGRNGALLQRALSMDVVRASEAQSWRHARTLNLPQCQGEEDPGRIAWEKANPSTAPAGSVAMLRCPQRAPAGNTRRLAWEESLPNLAPAGNTRRLDWEESLPQRAPAGNQRRLD
ncbi:hypothetical protein T492DRAFT_874974 [Pavlovales sp. CCMP2436]|nr:hypothetical protein T492DRAFT_874974 [Pavlovales sp. CCMP2436]